MERLTKTVNGVVTYIGQGNEFDTGMLAAELSSGQIRTVLDHLSAYEETGLEPEEIKELCTDDVAEGVVKRLKDKGWTIEPPENVSHE